MSTYVVKRREGDKDFYVRVFSISGIPARAAPMWDARQHLAFRWDERNPAANVAFDVDGRVVRLRTRSAADRNYAAKRAFIETYGAKVEESSDELRRGAERAMGGTHDSPAAALDALVAYLESRSR